MLKKDSPELYFGGHLVAYLDILGQSERLASLKQNNWWELQEPTKNILRETYGTVYKLRKIFEDFLASFVNPTPLDYALKHSLGGDELDIWNQFGHDRISSRFISDSIILTFPLVPSHDLIPLKSVYGVLAVCAVSMLASLNYRFAIRGAIEIGPCVFNKDTNEVYGTALSDACQYEKDVADWPRILIGPELMSFLHKCTQLPQDTVNQINVNTAKRCLKLISKGEDDVYSIDYLSPNFSEFYGSSNIDKDKHIEGAVSFIKTQIESYGDKPAIRTKYEKLKAYFIDSGVSGF